MAKYYIYGGQYGSEGKGCVTEYICDNPTRFLTGKSLIAICENAPNAGHGCKHGKTRCLPSAAFWADEVLIGPDACLDPVVFNRDVIEVNFVRTEQLKMQPLRVFIHEHAAVVTANDVYDEQHSNLEKRISSTVTGGGAARKRKYILRERESVAAYHIDGHPLMGFLTNKIEWLDRATRPDADYIFEGSQGLLLDTNWGSFPFVTSRSTHPVCSLGRTGICATHEWTFVGVFRSYPIRTGGPSGPFMGGEIKFGDIAMPEEITAVTKRLRRIGNFSPDELMLSARLCNPDLMFFTHMDYPKIVIGQQMFDALKAASDDNKKREILESVNWDTWAFIKGAEAWFHSQQVVGIMKAINLSPRIYYSFRPGQFHEVSNDVYTQRTP